MKAGVLFGNEDIRYVETDKPVISENEILVRVKMSGICGSDVPRVLRGAAHFYPIILGHEFSGVVEEIGNAVENLQPEDRVSGVPLLPCMQCEDCLQGQFSLCKHYRFVGSSVNGSFAQYVKLPATNAVKFDPSVSFEQGALFEPSTVALHGLRRAGFTGGKDVAVVGSGTIGIFVMQWAKIMGAKSVTVFDISEKRLSLAKKLGADSVRTTEELPEGAYGYVFDAAGNEQTVKTALRLAANRATVCLIGTPPAPVNFELKQWETIHRKELHITGSWMSYSAPFPGEEWTLTAHCFGTGQLKYDEALIFKTFPLSRIDEAFSLYQTPGAVGSKLMIDCGEEV